MSSATWTPDALWRERRRVSGACWRAVESQHRVSTMKLVDSLAEQALLESVIDDTKPAVPAECRHLHYLLFTPFRYGAPYPGGSRFRRAGLTAGVYYASRTPVTALAEMAFHRLLFFAESPATPWPVNAAEFTVFSVKFGSFAALDLTAPPLNGDRAQWTSVTSYAACQALADAARTAGIEAFKYESARDQANKGINLALFTCRAFKSRDPVARQSWRLQFGSHGAHAFCDAPEQRLEFGRSAFAADPRIAAMRWER